MEEQGKKNLQDAAVPAEQTDNGQNNAGVKENGQGAAPPNTPAGAGKPMYPANAGGGYPSQQNPPQYGYGPSMPGAQPYPQPYGNGYNQPFPQQGNYRPSGAAGYPNQQQNARPYGAYQQNANGTGPGQYNYKASMGQHGQNNSYSGAGPGQYDFRAPSQNAQGQKPQGGAAPTPSGQYGYNNYQQYPYKPQGGAGYGYYPQQFGAYPQNQPAYGPNMPNSQPGYGGQMPGQAVYGPQMSVQQQQAYMAQNPNRQQGYGGQMPNAQQQYLTYQPLSYGGGFPGQNGYPNQQGVQPLQMPNQNNGPVQKKAEKPSNNVNGQKKETPETAEKNEKSESIPVDGEIVREEITPDGKKKIVVKKVVKKSDSEETNDINAPSKFIENQIKAELGEDALKNGEKPIIQYKSKMKKKPDTEGVYKPSLKDMLLGPPKKDTSDKDADLWEWKCPDCGTVNKDYVSACKCGCTARRAKNIAMGRIPKDKPTEESRENNPLRFEENPGIQNVNKLPETEENAPADILTPNDTAEQLPPQEQAASEPAVPDDYDPEMPEKIERTEEEIQAEIDAWMSEPIHVWRPKSKMDSGKNQGPTEIYLVGNDKNKNEDESENTQEQEEKDKIEAEKAEEKPNKEVPKPEKAPEAKPEVQKMGGGAQGDGRQVISRHLMDFTAGGSAHQAGEFVRKQHAHQGKQ